MNIRKIPIKVENEYVKGAGVVIGASGSHDDVALKIHYGSMWDDLSKSIVWKDSTKGNAVTTLLSSSMLDADGDYIVPIPNEPKAYPGEIFVSFKGFDVDTIEGEEVETVAVLTAVAKFTVLDSEWDEDAEESQAITPSAAEQLQTQIDNVYTKSESDTLLLAKVDKVAGKGLSTNDYDNTEKTNVASNTSARHTHTNKSLLDTYTQTESNIADAVSKKHSHSNKSLLDTYDQTNADIKSAVDDDHTHSNKSVIDGISSSDVSSWTGKIDDPESKSAGQILKYNGNSWYADTLSSSENIINVEFTASCGQTIADMYEDGVEPVLSYDGLFFYLKNKEDVSETEYYLSFISFEPNATTKRFPRIKVEVTDGEADAPSPGYTAYPFYTKPSDGIPSTDMTSAVQTSLGKADTALQSHQDISGKEDKSNKVTSMSASSTDTEYPSAKAVYDELAGKQDTLVSGTNIKTINSQSILGSGDITISGGGGTWGSITGTLSDQTDLNTALSGKQATLTFDSTPTSASTNPVTSGGVYTALNGKVPTSRTVNAMALSSNIILDTDDIPSATYIDQTSSRSSQRASLDTPVVFLSGLAFDVIKGRYTYTSSSTGVASSIRNGDDIVFDSSVGSTVDSYFRITSRSVTSSYVQYNATYHYISTTNVCTNKFVTNAEKSTWNAKEDASNKVTSVDSSSTDAQYPSAKLVYTALGLKENTANKVTGISSSSTDTEYPSAKCVYDQVSALNADIADKQDEHKTATATLTVAGWSSSMQTVSVTGVTTSNTVIVAPSPSSLSAYGENGVYCSAQANGTLTFTCTDTPSSAITVNVVILD